MLGGSGCLVAERRSGEPVEVRKEVRCHAGTGLTQSKRKLQSTRSSGLTDRGLKLHWVTSGTAGLVKCLLHLQLTVQGEGLAANLCIIQAQHQACQRFSFSTAQFVFQSTPCRRVMTSSKLWASAGCTCAASCTSSDSSVAARSNTCSR